VRSNASIVNLVSSAGHFFSRQRLFSGYHGVPPIAS
jgi:hypothetical protein